MDLQVAQQTITALLIEQSVSNALQPGDCAWVLESRGAALPCSRSRLIGSRHMRPTRLVH